MSCVKSLCRRGPFPNCLKKTHVFLPSLLVFFGRGTSSFSALPGAGRTHLPVWLSGKRGGNSAPHGGSRGWLLLPSISQGDLATKIRLFLKHWHRLPREGWELSWLPPAATKARGKEGSGSSLQLAVVFFSPVGFVPSASKEAGVCFFLTPTDKIHLSCLGVARENKRRT